MTDVTEMGNNDVSEETLESKPEPMAEIEAILTPPPAQDEKALLMQRARLMGIRFSNNIGVEALRAKIAAQMEAGEPVRDDEEDEAPKTSKTPPAMAENQGVVTKMTVPQIRQKLTSEQLKLVRIRITCLDPKKKDLPGEIFTVANKFIGTVRKYVPFGEVTENGYHVPFCIYTMLKNRKFLSIRTKKSKNGTDQVETSYVPEFAIEVLPQLTSKELRELAIQQAAAKGQV